MCALNLLLVRFLPCSEGFSPGSLVFLPPQKPKSIKDEHENQLRLKWLTLKKSIVIYVSTCKILRVRSRRPVLDHSRQNLLFCRKRSKVNQDATNVQSCCIDIVLLVTSFLRRRSRCLCFVGDNRNKAVRYKRQNLSRLDMFNKSVAISTKLPATFNNIRTLKFKFNNRQMRFSLPPIKCSATPPSFRLRRA